MTPVRTGNMLRSATHSTSGRKSIQARGGGRGRAKSESKEESHTKRVPQYQSQLGHLFSLLAELQQRCLSSIFAQKVCNVCHCPPIVLRDVIMSTILPVRSSKAVVDVGVAAGHASVVRLLLSLLLSLLGLLLLSLLLLMLLLLSLLLSLLRLLLLGLLLLLSRRSCSLVGVLLLMMAGLLVHPGRIRLGIELVVAVDMRGWHHPGGFGGSVAAQQ